MRKFRKKNCKTFAKKWKLCKTRESFAKNTEFLKTNVKFQQKSCENSSKKTDFFLYKTHFQRGTYPQAQLMDKHLITTSNIEL